MNKLILLIILTLIVLTQGLSQSCLPNGIYFSTQSEIDDFPSDFPTCTKIGGQVRIEGTFDLNINTSLVNLSGLDNLIFIGGSLEISNCDLLLDLTGLNNVTSIGGSLSILDNQNLNSLVGLENLTSISGDLVIGRFENGNNPSLTNLSGIDNINSQTITNLYISHNSSLSMCEVKSICDYLANPNGIIDINNNATGCNTQNEVEEACLVSVTKTNYDQDLLIYPNPAQNKITISSSSRIMDLIIYNNLG